MTHVDPVKGPLAINRQPIVQLSFFVNLNIAQERPYIISVTDHRYRNVVSDLESRNQGEASRRAHRTRECKRLDTDKVYGLLQ